MRKEFFRFVDIIEEQENKILNQEFEEDDNQEFYDEEEIVEIYNKLREAGIL